MQQQFPGTILKIVGNGKDMVDTIVETRISFDGIDSCFDFHISEFREITYPITDGTRFIFCVDMEWVGEHTIKFLSKDYTINPVSPIELTDEEKEIIKDL
jgi:hypothetical protein